jgi:lipoyl(octanoyl) transferase
MTARPVVTPTSTPTVTPDSATVASANSANSAPAAPPAVTTFTKRAVLVAALGSMPYARALAVQRAAAQARIDGKLADDLLILVEHPPVITLGRSTNSENLLIAAEALAARAVELFEVDRGGDVTFHGPGQLVGYPIVDLRQHREDLHWYLRQLEETLIRALSNFGIPAGRRDKLTGVWTKGRKIASIGVHAKQWVTWHGFALNVTTDLSYFGMMVPCGIENVEMTSVAKELGLRPGSADWHAVGGQVQAAVTSAFGAVFGLVPQASELRNLGLGR